MPVTPSKGVVISGRVANWCCQVYKHSMWRVIALLTVAFAVGAAPADITVTADTVCGSTDCAQVYYTFTVTGRGAAVPAGL